MKVVILAGGFGTRISEESAFKPKPMLEIGGMPILWHIMKEYSCYGINRVYYLCRIQAACDQGVVCRLFSAYIGCYL